MFDKKECRDLRHDVICELRVLEKDMERVQKALFDVGMAGLGTSVGYWLERVNKLQNWVSTNEDRKA